MRLNSSKNPGTKIKTYIDTNIFVYAILHHPKYGELCAEILKDIEKKIFETYGSLLVAIELLGSLSRINPYIARRAVEDYLSIDMILLNVNREAIRLASIINEKINVKYDAVHAALMLLNNIPVIITNDINDWKRISRNFTKIIDKVEEEYAVSINKIDVITPYNYKKWKNSIAI